MSQLGPLGIYIHRRSPARQDNTEHVVVQRPLRQILAFTHRSIDDIVNDPVARNEVFGYYKLRKWVERGCEAVELERWWNPR